METATHTDRKEPPHAGAPSVVDLERYVPAFLTWIANKLSRGASQHYLNAFDVGIETWRCLVLLAIEGSISAQKVSRIIGMDKASVSRCFKGMQAKGLITLRLGDSIRPIAASTPAITARPPCTCSSAMSSPVSLFGAGNHSTSPPSSTSPDCGSRTARSMATRGPGRPPAMRSSTSPAFGPEMRITATPARPWPLDNAKMVGWSITSVLEKRVHKIDGRGLPDPVEIGIEPFSRLGAAAVAQAA